MAERYVDARGLACPQPVLLVRKAMLESGVDRVLVMADSHISAENIQRMASSQGWAAEVERRGQEIRLTIQAASNPAVAKVEPSQAAPAAAGSPPEIVVFLTSDSFGSGDERLGRILLKAFIKTLRDVEPRPKKAVFANAGVRLTTEGSEWIEDLRALEKQGVSVMSCGTCLDYYGLKDSLRVGVASNMYEIVSALLAADRIVQL